MLDGIDLTPTTEIPRLESNAKVDLLGLVKAMRPITTRRGDRMAFLTIEDYHGVTEALVFSDAYEKYRDLLIIDSALWLRGQIQARNGDRRLRVDEILTPETAAEKAERWCTIALPCPTTVTPEIDAALGRFLQDLRGCPGDRRVRLRVATPDGAVDLATPLRVTADENLRARAEALREEIAALGV
jgi:DNA polymerase-3 subunit alpha